MATETRDGSPAGTVAEVKEKGAELASSAQQQLGAKADELREETAFRFREQVDQRSTQMGEQVQAVGQADASSARAHLALRVVPVTRSVFITERSS